MDKITAIKTKIEKKDFVIGILGLGYVGLPLALEFCKAGFRVIGFDVNPKKIENIINLKCEVVDVKTETLKKALDSGLLQITSNFSKLKDVDGISICVPTPLSKSRVPDLSYISSAISTIKDNIKENLLIILESTTYPGTTRELLGEVFKEKGFKIGENIFIAFSPERVDPGNKHYQTKNTPKVLGGLSKNCLELSQTLYSQVIDKLVLVNSTEEAEMVKLLENTFRAVNIALVNEITHMCDRMNIDIWNVIDAASTKPFGFMSFYPGPGIGGHCIPLDPTFLSWKAKMFGHHNRFIELASDINENMPRFTVGKILRSLNDIGLAAKNSRILIIGLSYKKDVGDTRESPSTQIFKQLNELGATVSYHDPFVPSFQLDGTKYLSETLSSELLDMQDLVVLSTGHNNIDWEMVLRWSKKIFDCRNIIKEFNQDGNWDHKVTRL